ncbi:MAG: ABC transporter ATP-binding protein/permease [Ruminococcus sp.]|uniref:ABC transporter ATP-binding protein n=1 Tax=Ruminococcus sp. TaxID=41978 RepID=UPI0025F923FD|nr:ABC transporter ATP-binding protein [Ruminococcus sp.]MCR5541245.1 ABC transporter ATP-binding protein/permease [Ruminococcus sp.]
MNKKELSVLWKYIKEIYIVDNLKSVLFIFSLSAIKIFGVLIPPIYIIKIMDKAIPDNNERNIFLYISIIIAFTILDVMLGIGIQKLYNGLGKRSFIKYQKQCLDHLYRLDGKYLSNSSIGEKLTTMMNDVSQIRTLTSPNIFDFVMDTITAVVMMIFLARIQADMLLIVLCILPFIYFSQKYFQKKGMEKAIDTRDTQSSCAEIIETIVSNTLSCILSNGQTYFLKKHDERINKAEDCSNELSMVYAKNGGVLNFLSALFSITILGIGGFRVMNGSMTIGCLIAFNMYSQKLVIPVLKISNTIMTLQSVIVALGRMEIFRNQKEIESSSFEPNVFMNNENQEICFENVSFSYDDKPVLNGVSLNFKKNNFNVIVGESGCGKSTLTLLLYRIWSLRDGCIKIDGQDYKDYSIKDLRDHITIVGQESFLFNDTVLNNISLKENENMDNVIRCCKIACIHDFIMSLPEQYQSVVGDRGVKLSGGEKQRICIARALLNNTPIIVMDEATSALDQLTERKVIDNLKENIKDKIFILITHRLSSIVEADNIIVMKDGVVEAKGNHYELMQNSSYYKSMFERKRDIY